MSQPSLNVLSAVPHRRITQIESVLSMGQRSIMICQLGSRKLPSVGLVQIQLEEWQGY
jgi:hypothetical protein